MGQARYFAVWEFQVKAECAAEFESIYGPEGSWARLFRRSPEYLGTELLRDLERPGRYLTIDRWTSAGAFYQFKEAAAGEYAALDKQCERLTQAETKIGEFTAVT